MNRNKELVKNTIIIALGKICTQFVTFFLLPIYTRFLSTDEYGIVDLILTCTNLISPVLSLQLERSVFRFLVNARKDEDLQKKIITSSLTAVVPSIVLAFIIMPIIAAVFHIQYWGYILAIILTSIISNIILQIPRGLGKNIHFSIGSAIVGISNAIISILSVTVFSLGIKGVLVANIVSHIAGTLYVFVAMQVGAKIRLSNRSRSTLKQLLKFSIPMIPSDICYWIINASDRLLIYLFMNNGANGIYAAATKFPAFLVTAYNVFNMSWMETVSAHAEDGDASEYLSGVFNEIIKLSGSLCLVANAVISLAFNLVVGEAFNDAYRYVAFLVFGAFFNMVVGALSALYFGYKKTPEIAKTNALAAVINITINLALIKTIGIWAAVMSTVLAYVVVVIYRVLNIQKAVILKLKISNFIIISVAFAVNILLYLSGGVWLKIANLALMIVISLLYNRVFIKTTCIQAIKKLKKGIKQ